MLFDFQAALAEILACPAATPATPATPPPRVANVAEVARAPSAKPAPAFRHYGKEGEQAEPVAMALPDARKPADPAQAPFLHSGKADPPEAPFPYGFGPNGNPRTWTGRVVSLDDWRRMSAWERHGSTGQLWNGITRQWEPEGGRT